MNRQERGQELEAQVEEAIAELEAQLNEGHTQGFLEVLEFYSRFHKYSLANTMLIAMQNRQASLCAGFKTWSKLGYSVREGEKAIWIRAPHIRKFTDQQTGEIEEKLVGYLAVPIFDISQLEGEVELPSFRKPLEGDYDTYYYIAMAAMGAEGILVTEEPMPHGVHGMSSGGRVMVSDKLDPSIKFLTLLHEWAHEVMHQEDREDTTRNQRELEAESVSYLLAKVYGLENPFSRDYIISYGGTVEALHDSLTRIHMGVRKVVDKLGITLHQDIAEKQAA